MSNDLKKLGQSMILSPGYLNVQTFCNLLSNHQCSRTLLMWYSLISQRPLTMCPERDYWKRSVHMEWDVISWPRLGNGSPEQQVMGMNGQSSTGRMFFLEYHRAGCWGHILHRLHWWHWRGCEIHRISSKVCRWYEAGEHCHLTWRSSLSP